MKSTIAAAFAALVLTVAPVAAHAAPAEQACITGAIRQHDMAGTYTNPYMTLIVYPCGDIYLEWVNDYGQHSASYTTVRRVPGEGVIARADHPNDVRLDMSLMFGVKAAERGFVQIFTVSDITNEERVYRLRKIA